MRICRLSTEAGTHLGVVLGHEVVDLARAAADIGMDWAVPMFTDLRRFLIGGESTRALATQLASGDAARVALDSARLLAPVESGVKLLAHVVNYAAHGKEGTTVLTPPEQPFFFWKHSHGVVGPGASIVGHRASAKVDYEAELAVVIGRRGRDIPAARAFDHVAGYTVANDISFRDFQTNETCRCSPPATDRTGCRARPWMPPVRSAPGWCSTTNCPIPLRCASSAASTARCDRTTRPPRWCSRCPR
jgi:2-keto-4-pentenoate hydratase/2-oxohepta-3-ene-1,7-dioic acid hydratase in catechol pathway